MALSSKDISGLPPDLRRSAKDQIERPRKAGAGIPIPLPRGRRHKYNVGDKNQRYSKLWGCIFDSVAERLYGDKLWYLREAGQISRLERQVHVTLHDPDDEDNVRSYDIDFLYCEKRRGEMVFDEVKGLRLGQWGAFERLWAKCGPCTLLVTFAESRSGVLRTKYQIEIRPEKPDEQLRRQLEVGP